MAAVALRIKSVKELLDNQRYFEIAQNFSQRKFAAAEQLAGGLCADLKKDHFGNNVYNYVLKTRCICLCELGRAKEVEMHLRNVAEFAAVAQDVSSGGKLYTLFDILKHSLNYSIYTVRLFHRTHACVGRQGR